MTGVAAAYMNGVVTGPVATYYLGAGYGGYLLSLTAAVAALISVPNTLKLYVHTGCAVAERLALAVCQTGPNLTSCAWDRVASRSSDCCH